MIDDKEKDKLVQMIEKSEAGLELVMPTFVELFEAYSAILSPQAIASLDLRGRSRLPYYLIQNKLQRIQADFIEAYFTNKQFVNIGAKKSLKGGYYDNVTGEFISFTRGLYDGLNEASINALQNAVDYYTTEDEDELSNMYEPLAKVLRQIQLYGTGVLKVSWDFSNDGLNLERIELKDIKFDTGATRPKDLMYLVHDIYLSKDQIQAYADDGIFDRSIDLEKINDSANLSTAENPDEFKRYKLQDVYEKKGNDWYVSTLYNKDLVLRFETELPDGLPFIIGTIKDQEARPNGEDRSILIYGDSIMAMLIPIQSEMMIVRNQQLDILSRQLNPRYIINDRSINPFDFSNQKLSVIKGDGDKVKELSLPNLRDSNFNVERLGVEAQEIIGITDYSATGAKQMNKTATGMSILTSESSKLLQHLIRGANETLIKPLFRKISSLVWKYGSEEFFWGIDRSQKLQYQVGIDVGLGATNKETALNGKTMAYTKIVEMANIKMSVGINAQADLIKAEKFLHKEIFPLLGIENYEEYENENKGQTRSPSQEPNLGLPMSELGDTKTGANNRINSQGGYGQSQLQPLLNSPN